MYCHKPHKHFKDQILNAILIVEKKQRIGISIPAPPSSPAPSKAFPGIKDRKNKT